MDHVDPAAFEPGIPLLDAPHVGTGLDRNEFLSRRAEDFISEHGGAVSETALIAHVFGSSGSITLWRPLLQQLLGVTDALHVRADGWWEVASA
ncbi:MAG: hypothetical protein H0T49_11295, partial [Chloroflexia bacterium]|nr:hypothetical protein [Chloroflexia bacterium]